MITKAACFICFAYNLDENGLVEPGKQAGEEV